MFDKYKSHLSYLTKTKGQPVRELRLLLSSKYIFRVHSAYNTRAPRARTPNAYVVYALVEDKKSQTRMGPPVRIIAGRKVRTKYPGRKVTTAELNKLLKKRFKESVRASYDGTYYRNYFKFRFPIATTKIVKRKS